MQWRFLSRLRKQESAMNLDELIRAAKDVIESQTAEVVKRDKEIERLEDQVKRYDENTTNNNVYIEKLIARVAVLETALREIAKDSHDLDSKHNAQAALGGCPECGGKYKHSGNPPGCGE